MLSDEEKKAIEELKEEINKPVEVPEDKFDTFILYNIESARTTLNLIEKQSKEIEHQIEKRANQKKELAILNAKQVEFNKLVNTVNSYKGQFERQQKEIEELKEKNKTLKNLQNDTNRLYIEMIERKNYFERELEKLQDKIKAKIEELEKEIKVKKEIARKPMDRVERRLLADSIVELEKAKRVLQSLLEKE